MVSRKVCMNRTHESKYYKNQDSGYVWGGRGLKLEMGYRKGAPRVTDKVMRLHLLVSPCI